MGDLEPFKSRRAKAREAEVARKRGEIADRFRVLAEQAEKGEVTGYALVLVDAGGSKPLTEWMGICNATALGHGIGCLFHRFFRTHTS